MLEIKTTLVYDAHDAKGEVVELPEDTIKAVDDFVLASGCRSEGARERSFMYSEGVCTIPLDMKDEKHKYFCVATAGCRQNKTGVPCKGGDVATRTRNFCAIYTPCLLYTSPSPRDKRQSRMPSSA